MFAKDVLIFILLYFGLDLMHDDDNDPPHPFIRLRQTFVIWVFYILFSRQEILVTILAIILLCTYYIILDLIKYYKHQDEEKHKIYINKLLHINNNLVKVIVGVVFIGFVYYFYKKKMEYGNKFTLYKFLKGVRKCKNIK